MSSGLGWYLDEIGRVPLLTPAEELHLGALVRAWQDHPAGPDGCPKGLRRRGLRARDRFVAANLRLSVSFVSKRCKHLLRQLEQDDLIQMGNLGLVRAVERFDPTRGYKFSTYAYWWIRQAVNRYADCEARLVRLPGHHSQQIRRLATLTQQHMQRHGIGPSIHELAAAADMPLERVRDLLAEARTIASLDQPSEDGTELGDTISAGTTEPDDTPERRQLLAHLATLEPLERDVLTALYGLRGEALSPTATAQLVGLPGPRDVRTIERLALEPLRQQLHQPGAVAPPERFAHLLGMQLRLNLAG